MGEGTKQVKNITGNVCIYDTFQKLVVIESVSSDLSGLPSDGYGWKRNIWISDSVKSPSFSFPLFCLLKKIILKSNY